MVVIGDADGLIALMQEDDVNHTLAHNAVKFLAHKNADIVFPLTAIVEAVTTLQRKLNDPTHAEALLNNAVNKELVVEEVSVQLLGEAQRLFSALGSKQNTIFDAIVAAMAKQYNADAVFSFDGWYPKQKLRSIPELL